MTNVQDEIVGHIDEHEEDTGADDASGTSPSSLSLPDQSPRAELITAIATAVAQAIEQERKHYDARRKGFIETQSGGFVVFARYTVPVGEVIQICREKQGRKSVTITCYTDTATVSIGQHKGIMASGTDTVSVVGVPVTTTPLPRVIGTTQALWATASLEAVIDVQEEFI